MDRRTWQEPLDERIIAEDVSLARGGRLRIHNGRQLLVFVTIGSVWITQDRDQRDVMLEAGEWFRLDRDGMALVSAQPSARIIVSAPLDAPTRWRIEQVALPVHRLPGAARRRHTFLRSLLAIWLRLHRRGAVTVRNRWRAGHFGGAWPRTGPA